MRVLVCGDRTWTDRDVIAARLVQLPPTAHVVHGGAHGADTIAGEVAAAMGLVVTCVPARWTVYGRAAGPIRNRAMLDLAPTLVIAFHADLSRSRGTRDCVEEATRRGIPIEVIGGA